MNIYQDLARVLPVEKSSWERYFISSALMATIRTDCTRRQFGAIVVSPENRILAAGYNGPPKGIPSKVEEYIHKHGCQPDKGFGCCKGIDAPKNQSYDQCIANHAEANALLHVGVNNHHEWIDLYIAGRDGQTGEIIDSTPCIMCSRLIRQFNIRKVHSLMATGDVKTIDPSTLKISV